MLVDLPMRKLFFFGSSTSNNGNSNYNVLPQPACDNEKVYWDMPLEKGVSGQASKKTKSSSQSPKNSISRPRKLHPGSQNSDPSPSFRRSRSLSSSTFSCSVLGERNMISLCESSGSPSISSINILPQSFEQQASCLSCPPEKQPKDKVYEGVVTQRTDYLCPSRCAHDYSGNSSHSIAPAPLRCESARLAHVSNKILDLYIDGEQHADGKALKPRYSSFKHSSSNENCKGWRLPADSSKEKPRSYSVKELKDACLHFTTRYLMRNQMGHENSQELAKYVVERLSQAFPHKSRAKSWDFNPEPPATVGEVSEDYLDSHHGSDSNEATTQKKFQSDSISGNLNLFHGNDTSCLQKQSHFLEDFPEHTYLAQMDENDAELRRNAQEAQKRVILLAEVHEQETIVQDCGFRVQELLETIRNLSEERKRLAIDVSALLHYRIAERASSKEALQVAKADLDSQTWRLVKEKNELQLGLENELDRRSSECLFKLGKCQAEEQRLREQIRELAEQNVSLQREVSSFRAQEVESQSRISHLEQQLKDPTENLQIAKRENQDLHQTVSELQEQKRGADADINHMRRNYKDKENENKELQKTIVRLQRTCSEQDKTINGLRQVLNEELGRSGSSENHDNNHTSKLQMEQMRLTGVEQILRTDVESYRREVESLRHENINLLGRLQDIRGDGGSSFFKLDHELQARVDCLLNQGLSQFGESNNLCLKLFEFIKRTRNQVFENVSGVDNVQEEAGKNGLDRYFLLETDIKLENLNREFENLTRSLHTVNSVLHKKYKPVFEIWAQTAADAELRKFVGYALEENVNLRLKEETLLTSLLREKLFTKQLELDQLQAELATAVAGQEILRSEVQSALDALSCISHKMKNLEIQMLRKDESIGQLRSDLQECNEELTITKSSLKNVYEERDLMWEEVKQYSEKNMLLNSEVNLLKMKIEALEEDILLKEGQITILKDSLDSESSIFLCLLLIDVCFR